MAHALALEVAATGEVFQPADGAWFTASSLEGRVALRPESPGGFDTRRRRKVRKSRLNLVV